MTPPNNVVYTVTVEASPEICSERPVTAQVQFIGFGLVELNITFQCDCGCDPPVSVCVCMCVASFPGSPLVLRREPGPRLVCVCVQRGRV